MEMQSTPSSAIPRNFQRNASVERCRLRDPHRFAPRRGVEVVDQDPRAAFAQRFFQLRQRFHFHDQRQRRMHRARRVDRARERACRADVIFLQHYCVVETNAVIGSAAHAHRVFLRQPQPGYGLAGVEDLRAGAAHRVGVACGHGGGAAQGLQEIQRGALGADQRTAASGERGDHGAFGDAVAFGDAPVDTHAGIERTMAGVEPRTPADHRVFLAQQIGDVGAVGQQRRSDVAAADVFDQRRRDVCRNHFG
jgi:hypothetical protein